jgi:hypothetical protein
MAHTIALFGEAEKGEYRMAYFCDSLPELVENLGNPPSDSKGLHYAIQVLLYHRHLIFFRVKEEGYSIQDYMLGLRFLENRQLIPQLSAVCMPGVGDAQVIHAGSDICNLYKSLLVINESDLYDYITSVKTPKGL